mmetsp:Transcript_8834/g.26757  ORF Transcript_8834/g.26757 Transcript_8834/m.26757 type:complete len:407 (-) Transcript_8834:145-1365(-)
MQSCSWRGTTPTRIATVACPSRSLLRSCTSSHVAHAGSGCQITRRARHLSSARRWLFSSQPSIFMGSAAAASHARARRRPAGPCRRRRASGAEEVGSGTAAVPSRVRSGRRAPKTRRPVAAAGRRPRSRPPSRGRGATAAMQRLGCRRHRSPLPASGPSGCGRSPEGTARPSWKRSVGICEVCWRQTELSASAPRGKQAIWRSACGKPGEHARKSSRRLRASRTTVGDLQTWRPNSRGSWPMPSIGSGAFSRSGTRCDHGVEMQRGLRTPARSCSEPWRRRAGSWKRCSGRTTTCSSRARASPRRWPASHPPGPRFCSSSPPSRSCCCATAPDSAPHASLPANRPKCWAWRRRGLRPGHRLGSRGATSLSRGRPRSSWPAAPMAAPAAKRLALLLRTPGALPAFEE